MTTLAVVGLVILCLCVLYAYLKDLYPYLKLSIFFFYLRIENKHPESVILCFVSKGLKQCLAQIGVHSGLFLNYSESLNCITTQ